ncbi:MAG: glycosyltransferase [Candidatus Binataceae bacterium]
MHLLPSKVRAGAEEQALSLLVNLREFGFEPYFAAPSALLAAMEPELRAARVNCVPLEVSSSLDLAAGARLACILSRERIDILHCHLFIASLFGAGAARIAGVGTVIETCHGPEVWRIGKRLRGGFWVDRQVSRLVDRYIAVSPAAASHLIENKGVPRAKVRVIRNGRDLDRYAPQSKEEGVKIRGELGLGGGPVILVLARLAEQKGHRHLIDAIARLVPRWPRLTALFAGEGPLEGALREQCAALKLNGQVRFLGYRGDVRGLLAAADLVALPSLYEGLPLVAIEALAAGKPIVATAVDGTPEVVIDGQTGLLVPPADPGALAQAIERVLADPALGASLAAAGQAHVRENFGLRRQVEETIALYRELIGVDNKGVAA